MAEQIIAPQPIEPTFTGTPLDVVADGTVPVEGQISATPEYVIDGLRRDLDGATRQIDTLTHELARANERVEQFRQREHNAENRYNLFRESVSGWFSDAVSEGTLTKDEANSGLDALQLPRLTTKWRVTVQDSEYNTVLVVIVEADDEDEAIDQVRDDISVSATIKTVEYTLDYNGEGEAVEGPDTYEEEPFDDADEYADAWQSGLTFEAEEVDD